MKDTNLMELRDRVRENSEMELVLKAINHVFVELSREINDIICSTIVCRQMSESRFYCASREVE